MKWHTLLLIIFWPVLLKPAFAAGQLHVELRYPIQENGRRLDVGDGRVEVVLENTGDQTIEVYERSIPSINKSGVLTHHYFEVLNETSASARYVGILAYHDARSQDKYRTLAPGERHVIGVPIFRSYEVRPDYWYEVKLAPAYYLQQPLRHFSSKSNDDLRAAWVEAHAQPLVIRADGVSVRSERQASPAWGTAITPTPCSSNDLAALEMARVDAAALAQEALIHEANLYGYFFDENDEIVITFSPSLRYGKWFGKRGDPNASLPDDEYVSSTLLGTSQRLSNNEPWGLP